MGTQHRGVTDQADRGESSTISAPPPLAKLERAKPAHVVQEVERTGTLAKQVIAPPASGHVKVGPDKRDGASTINTTPTPEPAQLATAVPVAAPTPEAVDDTKAKVIALLATLADDEIQYPKEGPAGIKRKRASWVAEGLAALSRLVLKKETNLPELKINGNMRTTLIGNLREPLQRLLGSEPVRKPKFLG